MEGNAKLQASQSTAQVVGPGIGGGLAQLAGAANTVLATGLGYLASGLFLLRIRTVEPEPRPHDGRPLRTRIAQDLRFVFGNPTLRPMTASGVGGVLGAIVAVPGWRVALVAAGMTVMSFGVIVYNVAQVSYRQAICPDHLLGRMSATMRFVVWGTMPIGGLIGGALGAWLGVRGTL